MQCKDFKEGISLFIDGETALEERNEWEHHRDECSACSALYDRLSCIDGLVRTIPDASPAPMNPYELMAYASESRRPREQPRAWAMRFVMACALMIILLGCFFYLYRGVPILLALRLPAPGPSVAAVIDEPAVRYDVELNDSRYYVAVYGKEVSLVSFDMTANGSSGISMSFADKK